MGKSETMAAAGMPVPGGVIEHDLMRLGGMIKRFGAKRVLVLGDLLHAPAGLAEGMVERVAAWMGASGAVWEIVPGNHDRKLERVAERWGLGVHGDVHVEEGMGFVHDGVRDGRRAVGLSASFVWSGHVHPLVRIRGNGDRLRLPCFFVTGVAGVLPAFSFFTGGVLVDHLDPSGRAYAIADECVMEIGCGEERVEKRRGWRGRRCC